MCQIGEHEFRFQLARRGGQRRHICVELTPTGPRRQFAVLGQQPFAVSLFNRGCVPLQLQRVAPLPGRPVALGDHGHAFATTVDRHAQHCLDTLDGSRGAVVHRSQSRAKHRRMCHHGSELTGQARVDTEILAPAALGMRIDARGGRADDAKVLRVLQRDFLRHRQGHGGLGQFAVAQRAATRTQHHPCAGAQRGHVHVPARRRRRQQHRSGTGAKLAVLREAVLDRMRTAGEMNAEQRVDVGSVVRAVPAVHLAPVRVELLGQDHRQGSLHALAELQPVDGHCDLAAGSNLHKRQWLLRRLQGARGAAGTGGLCHGQMRKCTERQADGAGQLQEAAARQHGGFVALAPRQQPLQVERHFDVETGQHSGSFR
ncbi:hypothetical protein D9M69_163710 [compost metagenome]